MDRSARMGSEPIGKLLFEFAVPSTASMLVIALYSLADRIFIGRSAGVDGIAAATAAFPFMIVGLAVGLLFSVGSRAVASVALGGGDANKAREAVSRGVGAAFLAAAIVAVFTWMFARPLLSLFGASPRIAESARIFLGILLIGLPFQAATMTAASSLQVQGRPGTSFILNLAGTALNVALDPLFIFGFGWGIAGAAAATTIAQVLGCLVVIAVVQGKRSTLKIDRTRIAPVGRIVSELISVGMPIFLVHIVSTITMVVANNAIRPYGGDLGLAAIGVVNTIGMVVSYPMYGITNGAQPLFGYNYGAKKWDRLRRLSLLVVLWTGAFAILAEAVAVLAPRILIGLFSDDPALAEMGSRALSVFMAAFALMPISQLPATYFQSTGKPVPTGVLMLSRNIVMILGMILLPLRFGLMGVYLAGPAADIATAMLGGVLLVRMGKEIRRGRGELEIQAAVNVA